MRTLQLDPVAKTLDQPRKPRASFGCRQHLGICGGPEQGVNLPVMRVEIYRMGKIDRLMRGQDRLLPRGQIELNEGHRVARP